MFTNMIKMCTVIAPNYVKIMINTFRVDPASTLVNCVQSTFIIVTITSNKIFSKAYKFISY